MSRTEIAVTNITIASLPCRRVAYSASRYHGYAENSVREHVGRVLVHCVRRFNCESRPVFVSMTDEAPTSANTIQKPHLVAAVSPVALPGRGGSETVPMNFL